MTFEEIVREKMADLSAGQRKTAFYLSEHKEEISYDTLAKLSGKIGVSETTVIRTAFSLGFDSFSGMQRKIQEEILGAVAQVEEKQKTGFCQSLIHKEIAGLKELAAGLEEARLMRAAEHLWQADQVFVVGDRGSLGNAVWFSDALGHLRGSVYTIRMRTEEEKGRLLDITEESAIFCISMSRYSKASVRAVREAKKRGARVILITDSPVSPATVDAEEVFVVKSLKNELGFNSFISAFCVENMLIAVIRKNHAKESAERIQKYEELCRQEDIFYE